jgi:uncharacterized protein (DUF4415 family)
MSDEPTVGADEPVAETSEETSGREENAPDENSRAPEGAKRRKKKRAAPSELPKQETAARVSAAVLERGRARRTFAISAILLLAGIALSAADQAAIGAWVAVTGLAGAIWGTHLLGRLGLEVPPS